VLPAEPGPFESLAGEQAPSQDTMANDTVMTTECARFMGVSSKGMPAYNLTNKAKW